MADENVANDGSRAHDESTVRKTSTCLFVLHIDGVNDPQAA